MERDSTRLPTILVVACTDTKSCHELVQDIIGDTSVEPLTEQDDIQEFQWNLDTKYYTAAVTLSAAKHRTVPSQEFSEAVEAVVIFFDPKDRSRFGEVKLWLSTVEQLYSPAVRLIVCQNSMEHYEVPRKEIQEFCIERQLELIELEGMADEEDEEDFGSVHGIKRVQDALKAHTWPSLKLKPNPLQPPHFSSSDSESEPVEVDASNVPTSTAAESSTENVEEKDVDVFSQMFSKLVEFRAAANTLPREERKHYAEQITKQFWTSLGNDSDQSSDND